MAFIQYAPTYNPVATGIQAFGAGQQAKSERVARQQAELAKQQQAMLLEAYPDMLQAEVDLIQQQADYFAPEMEAKIAKTMADAAQTEFLTSNPIYMAQNEAALLDYLIKNEQQLAGLGGQPAGMAPQAMGAPGGPIPGVAVTDDMLQAVGQPVGVQTQNLPGQYAERMITQMMRLPEEQVARDIDVRALEDLSVDADLRSISAVEAKKQLDAFHDAYKGLGPHQRGLPYRMAEKVGQTPLLGAGVQEAERAASEFVNLAGTLYRHGHVSNDTFERIQASKPSAGLSRKAEHTGYHMINADLLRKEEEINFVNTATRMGLDAQEQRALWNTYSKQRPSTDKNGPNYKYLNTWQDYLTPENITRWRQDSNYRPGYSDPTKIKSEEFVALSPEQQLSILYRTELIEQYEKGE